MWTFDLAALALLVKKIANLDVCLQVAAKPRAFRAWRLLLYNFKVSETQARPLPFVFVGVPPLLTPIYPIPPTCQAATLQTSPFQEDSTPQDRSTTLQTAKQGMKRLFKRSSLDRGEMRGLLVVDVV